MREALFRRHTFVFKGDAYTGKVVFAPLHAEVRAITVDIEDMVLRVDAFDRPKEVTSASFAFSVTHEIAPVPPVEEAHNARVGEGSKTRVGTSTVLRMRTTNIALGIYKDASLAAYPCQEAQRSGDAGWVYR